MQHPDARILIFAKAPIPGQVKTRLIPPLAPEAAADLYAELLQQTLETAARAGLAPIELHCAPNPAHPLLVRLAADFDATLHPQQGDNLGARMHHALSATLMRAQSAILIGGDIPSLRAADLAQALAALDQGMGAALGPAEDGGYYLIGMKQADHRLFSDIQWGTGEVLAQTRQRLREMGWQWSELTERWDLDRPEDLARYRARGRGDSRTDA